MLTADLIRPRLYTRQGEIRTRPLKRNATNRQTAAELITLFLSHVNEPRRVLDEALAEYEGVRVDYAIIRGLAKVLSDGATFANEPPVDPVELRTALFALAAERGPVAQQPDLLHPTRRADVVAEVAARFGISTATVEQSLYADLLEEQILLDCSEWTPDDLIARYNLELARGLLYWASELRLTVRGGYQDLFKYIKLFKLMHTICPLDPANLGAGYQVTLDGPISPFVNATLRYGRQMAKFLPGLMLCPAWTMEADIHSPRRSSRPATQSASGVAQPLRYRLDSGSNKLRSHYKASAEYDSRLEADFAKEFEEKFGGSQRRWTLSREDEIVPVGDTVMIPDFSFTHVEDGRRALVEIAGFWHPDYLQRKAWKLRQAGRRDLIVVAYRSANTTDETWADVPGEVLMFTRKPVIKEVMAAVERCAVLP